MRAHLNQVYFDFLVMRLLEIKQKYGQQFAFGIFAKAIMKWQFSHAEIEMIETLLESTNETKKAC